MKIVFFGTPDYVEPVIDALDKNFKLLTSIRNPKQLDSETIEQLKNLNPDLFVVASFGKIFTSDFLDIPKYGTLNIHPSLLPKFRGPTPVPTALLTGVKKTGVSIIKIDAEIDHGPILAQKEEEILDSDTAESLLVRLFKIGAQMLPETITKYIKGEIKISDQDHEKATFTEHLTKEDGHIDLEKISSSLEIARMVRAYYPWPGVWFKTELSGKEMIIKLLPDKKIQVEGRRSMSFRDFINGYKEGKELLNKLNLLYLT